MMYNNLRTLAEASTGIGYAEDWTEESMAGLQASISSEPYIECTACVTWNLTALGHKDGAVPVVVTYDESRW